MGRDVLEGFSLAGDEVEAVEDGVCDVANGAVGEELEGVGPLGGECEGVAGCEDSYLVLIDVSYKINRACP